ARVHRLSPALRAGHRHRDSGGLVRPRATRGGRGQSPRATGGRPLPPRAAGRPGQGFEQRRRGGRARPDLPHRPRPRSAHPGARLGDFTRLSVRCLTGMNNRTDHGYLVLADVSGFTAFVTTTELEHGSEIIGALLDEVIAHLSPPLEVQEIEGDAVFALAGADSKIRLLEILDAAFVAFKARQRAMVDEETCPCGACQQIWRLDLKMVVHHG